MKNIFLFFKNSKVKMVIILSFLLFIYTTICAMSYAQSVSSDIAESVFRLHVIANSDSQEDQNLKYVVRDNLLSYMNEICKNTTNKEEDGHEFQYGRAQSAFDDAVLHGDDEVSKEK